MGAVCSSGKPRNQSEHFEKVKRKKSFGKKVESFSDSKTNDLSKTTSKSFSGDSKPSTPIRSKPSTPSRTGKIIHHGLGIASEKAVNVMDRFGSIMPKMNPNSELRISILAFEVANTIVKSANLLQSLSEENIQVLKTAILHSEGVQKLVSTDMKELLSFAAADKRQEFDLFLREVIRFGDMCKNPEWHNLDRYFSRLDSDVSCHKELTVESDKTIQELTTLAQHTSELYHELNAFDRFEQDYRRKLEEAESLNLHRGGESLTMFHSELKQQRKIVRSLKKKSLWYRSLEEIVRMLVDVATCMHQAIREAFGENGITLVSEEPSEGPKRLGASGLALHYANTINQINIIVSRPTSLPPNLRDQLYRGLPTSVKIALRSRLQAEDPKQQLSISQVKAAMEKTLQWLVPVATNTTKAHQGFGWVGEWANASNELSKNTSTQSSLIRLQTLYYADKQKTDLYILELVASLHRLINLIRRRDHCFKRLPMQSPSRKALDFHSKMQQFLSINCTSKTQGIQLSQEDRDLLDEVIGSLRVPGISKSQDFAMAKNRGTRVWALSRSTGSSPSRELGARQDLKAADLDVTDGLDII